MMNPNASPWTPPKEGTPPLTHGSHTSTSSNGDSTTTPDVHSFFSLTTRPTLLHASAPETSASLSRDRYTETSRNTSVAAYGPYRPSTALTQLEVTEEDARRCSTLLHRQHTPYQSASCKTGLEIPRPRRAVTVSRVSETTPPAYAEALASSPTVASAAKDLPNLSQEHLYSSEEEKGEKAHHHNLHQNRLHSSAPTCIDAVSDEGDSEETGGDMHGKYSSDRYIQSVTAEDTSIISIATAGSQSYRAHSIGPSGTVLTASASKALSQSSEADDSAFQQFIASYGTEESPNRYCVSATSPLSSSPYKPYTSPELLKLVERVNENKREWFCATLPDRSSIATAQRDPVMKVNDPYSFACLSQSEEDPRDPSEEASPTPGSPTATTSTSNGVEGDGAAAPAGGRSYAAALVGDARCLSKTTTTTSVNATAVTNSSSSSSVTITVPLPRSRCLQHNTKTGEETLSVPRVDVAAAIAKRVTQAAAGVLPSDETSGLPARALLHGHNPCISASLVETALNYKMAKQEATPTEQEPVEEPKALPPKKPAVSHDEMIGKRKLQRQQQQQQQKAARKRVAQEWVIVGGSSAMNSNAATVDSGKKRTNNARQPVPEGIGCTTQFEVLRKLEERGKGKKKTKAVGTFGGKNGPESEKIYNAADASSSEDENDWEEDATARGSKKISAKSKKRNKTKTLSAQQLAHEEEQLLRRLEEASTADAIISVATARSAGFVAESIIAQTHEAGATAAATVSSVGNERKEKPHHLCLMNVAIHCFSSVEDLLTDALHPRREGSDDAQRVSSKARSLAALLQRSFTLSESTNAKTMLLQRALTQLTPSIQQQFPRLACAILLEASDCLIDFERSVQCAHQALQLSTESAEQLLVFEMLARLATTRVLARVIDTSGAEEHLVRAAALALELGEKHALGYITLQLGITLELSGNFPDSILWYVAAERLAEATEQPRLLCDVLCCRAIANYAVGESQLADSTHARSVALFDHFPPAWRQRPLQNFVQLMLQTGDMSGALAIHKEELLVAKQQGDNATVSRCIGSIALALRYLMRYEDSAAEYMHELSTYCSPDARQIVESLTGAASCFLLSGHTLKARDYAIRAVRHANASNEQCTMAKALVELAEVELQQLVMMMQNDTQLNTDKGTIASNGEDYLHSSRRHVVEALNAMQGVDPVDRKQYLVKATLCELEWRCCSLLQRIAFQASQQQQRRQGEGAEEGARMLEALLCSDLCNVPNTTDVHALLSRREHMYTRNNSGIVSAGGAPSSSMESMGYLTKQLVSENSLVELLSSDLFAHRKIVCYSLPWTEESACMAFVLCIQPSSTDSTQCELVVKAIPLSLCDELICLLTNPSALNAVFDAEMWTLDAPARKRVYGDTPLWPQHYSVTAFNYEAKHKGAKSTAATTVACEGKEEEEERNEKPRLVTDAQYCLELLYQSFIMPIEKELAFMSEGTKADKVHGVTFIADGIFTRIPFHALYDGKSYLTQRLSVTTCCSLRLLCTLYAGYKKQQQQQQWSKDERAVQAYLVDVAASSSEWENTSVVAGLSQVSEIRHTTVDADAAMDATAMEVTSTATAAVLSTECAEVKSLLDALQSCRKDKAASNCLYSAVHEHATLLGQPLPSVVLELNIPVVPQVREDFCGFCVASQSNVRVCHSLDVAYSWDLHRTSLVVCSGFGTYSGLSIHETGIPVYRSLQYAGAPRLLLSIGTSLPTDKRVGVAAMRATGTATATAGGIADAVKAERCRLIESGASLSEWATYTLCGLP